MSEIVERDEEVRGFADALRGLIESFVATSAPPEVFAGIVDDLRAVTAKLAEYPQAHLYFGFHEAAVGGEAVRSQMGIMDNSPLMGRANPLAPPLVFEVHDDRVTGSVRFGSAYEGPPGHVHGGFVAAAFDELLGLTQTLSGQPGMTGRLTVHYRKPTPLRRDLRLEGTIDRVDGRKIFCSGRLYDGETLCAEADGLFIHIGVARFAALRAEREGRDPAS
jgi:acyl-coenzyme A thioesterase PaaI-like protein